MQVINESESLVVRKITHEKRIDLNMNSQSAQTSLSIRRDVVTFVSFTFS